MPKVTEVPKALRPYLSLGLSLDVGEVEAKGECPFCNREGKFSINVESGLWKCWACSEGSEKGGGGNAYTFVKLLWELSDAAGDDCAELAAERKLVDPETPAMWGACRSILTGEWLLPSYNAELKLVQLARWGKDWRTGKRRLLNAEGLSVGLYVPRGFSAGQEVFVCEGPWDAMALWELDRSRCVLAVPGAMSFQEPWCPLFAGRDVVLLHDNDHPRLLGAGGKLVDGAGLAGARRTARMLAGSKAPPASVRWLRWGDGGHDPSLPHGHDVRDWLTCQS